MCRERGGLVACINFLFTMLTQLDNVYMHNYYGAMPYFVWCTLLWSYIQLP